MKHQEKIGRPSMDDLQNRANIELGQPVLKEEFGKESLEATLYAIKEALEEFYRRRSIREERTAIILQSMRDPMKPYVVSVKEVEKEIRKENGDVTIPLAILEAARGEIQYEYDFLDSLELDTENRSANEKVETTRQSDFEKEMHYQEASDVLFSYTDYETPTRDELIEFLSETKKYIRGLVKEEEGADRIFRPRLLTDVPAIERYETGRQTTRDYNEIMEVIGSRLWSYRDRIGAILLQYAGDPQKIFVSEIGQLLRETRKLELFLSQLEGERNERIAKRQP